jgi:hypothetical protein
MPQVAGILCSGLAAGQIFGTWQDVLLGQALWVVSYWIGCHVIDWCHERLDRGGHP